MSAVQNPLQIDIHKNSIPLKSPLPDSPLDSKQKSIVPFIIAGLAGLLFLFAAGAAIIFTFYSFDKTENAVVPNNPKPTATAITNNDNQNGGQNEKLTNLEKQIQEPNNRKRNSGTSPFPSPAQNNLNVPKARVAQTNDGFLSLRTEPSVKTGTQLVKIPSGAVVNLENCERNYMTIDGRRGRWCLVSYAGKIGWAFDGWLIY